MECRIENSLASMYGIILGNSDSFRFISNPEQAPKVVESIESALDSGELTKSGAKELFRLIVSKGANKSSTDKDKLRAWEIYNSSYMKIFNEELPVFATH